MNLREAREARSLTLADACAGIGGIDPAGLSRIERRVQMPGRDLAKRIHTFYAGAIDFAAIFGVADEQDTHAADTAKAA
jgi:transcriptional regulator with XRE-family HTH domain